MEVELQLSIPLYLLWIYGFNSTQLGIFFSPTKQSNPTNQIWPNYIYNKFKLKKNQTFLETKSSGICGIALLILFSKQISTLKYGEDSDGNNFLSLM